MPLMRCTRDGKSGWKYGNKGHCYTGPDAKEKAKKQGAAIEANKSEGATLERCTKNGEQGWKARGTNRCFTGPNAREKALEEANASVVKKTVSWFKEILGLGVGDG